MTRLENFLLPSASDRATTARMATHIEQYLPERFKELQEQLVEAHARVAKLEDELAKLCRAAEASGVDLHGNVHEGKNIESPLEKFLQDPKSDMTIKSAAINILDFSSGGLTSKEILDIMKNRYNMDYPRSSLSPQLSRLKGDGIVQRQNGRWVLAKHIK